MKTISSNMTISQLCEDFEEKKIIVNRDYQRSDKVWPENARSFLELHGSWWITETGADGIGGWGGKTDSS